MNYLETLSNIFKSKKRRVENLVLIVVLLVIILIACKFIFKDSNSTSNKLNIMGSEEEKNKSSKNNNETLNVSGSSSYVSELEQKLTNILSQISGISDVSVVITYSQDTKQNPIYNTKEEETQGKTTTEKNVAYNESGNSKTAIIESVEMPKIEGAIIVAKGANSVDIKSKIATAVANLTQVPVYKIQVFEKQG